MLFWLIDRLELTAEDTLFVAIAEGVNSEFSIDMQLHKEYPKLNVKLIPLKFDTRGAAETLFVVAQSMTEQERARRTISLDCDTIYVSLARIVMSPSDDLVKVAVRLRRAELNLLFMSDVIL